MSGGLGKLTLGTSHPGIDPRVNKKNLKNRKTSIRDSVAQVILHTPVTHPAGESAIDFNVCSSNNQHMSQSDTAAPPACKPPQNHCSTKIRKTLCFLHASK